MKTHLYFIHYVTATFYHIRISFCTNSASRHNWVGFWLVINKTCKWEDLFFFFFLLVEGGVLSTLHSILHVNLRIFFSIAPSYALSLDSIMDMGVGLLPTCETWSFLYIKHFSPVCIYQCVFSLSIKISSVWHKATIVRDLVKI